MKVKIENCLIVTIFIFKYILISSQSAFSHPFDSKKSFNFLSKMVRSLATNNNELDHLLPENTVRVLFEIKPNLLQEPQQSYMDVQIFDTSIKYILYASKKDLSNPIYLFKYLLLFQSISSSSNPNSEIITNPSRLTYSSHGQFTISELINNANSGSLMSKLMLLKISYFNLETAQFTETFLKELFSLMPTIMSLEQMDIEVKKELSSLDKEIKHLERLMQKQYDVEYQLWSKSISHFNNDSHLSREIVRMVKNNHRDKFSKVVNSIIPWRLLEPSEKLMWTEWLRAIEEPVKNEEKPLFLFRGFSARNNPSSKSTDYYERASTFVPFKKFIRYWEKKVKDRNPSTPYRVSLTPPTVNSEFISHASNSDFSPFISFTTDLETASIFAEEGIVAIKANKRRGLVNLNNASESEYLIPMVVFPDEVYQLSETTKELEELIHLRKNKNFNQLGLIQLSNLLSNSNAIMLCNDLFK